MNAPPEEAEAHAKQSIKENRVYCGNLTYSTTYKDLLDYMKEAGEVAFAEIFVTPGGQSKGCGIVEYVERSSAERATQGLGEKTLLGRPVFIREDREAEARFGAAPVPGKIGAAFGEARPLGRPVGAGFGTPHTGPPVDYRQLFVGNLPYTATWQDMKDLFREAGAIIRADVATFPDGRPKGTGIVVFETHEDAKNAVATFNGYSWQDSILQVRPDRFAGGPSFRGGRGGFAPRGGFAGRGGFVGRGGFAGPPPPGRGGRYFTNDLYADYNGPEGVVGAPTGPSASLAPAVALEPSKQIMIRNLPWSTSNEDLVELFETTGQVVLAEILYEGTRSKGSGVVQFKEVEEAEQAGQKFTGYVYGGRPLDVQFNDRWHRFSDTAAQGTTGATA